ncbi:MAG TPA: class I SAM-dependent methyltransferase [Thermoleophilaceae bacterium]
MGIATTMRRALGGELPERYVPEFWLRTFRERVEESLRPGQAILDVGSGRAPAVPPAERPAGVHYVGLDISSAELAAAQEGSYDERVTGDVSRFIPELEGRFDLALSYQVFEHVKPLPAALGHIHRYLKPGGVMVAQLSGTFSVFGLLNRVVPSRFATWALERFLNRAPESVFPAFYDRCWHSALARALQPWPSVEIIPLYTGADYLAFVRPLQALYLGFEDLAWRGDRRNLASYYIIVART